MQNQTDELRSVENSLTAQRGRNNHAVSALARRCAHARAKMAEHDGRA